MCASVRRFLRLSALAFAKMLDLCMPRFLSYQRLRLPVHRPSLFDERNSITSRAVWVRRRCMWPRCLCGRLEAFTERSWCFDCAAMWQLLQYTGDSGSCSAGTDDPTLLLVSHWSDVRDGQRLREQAGDWWDPPPRVDKRVFTKLAPASPLVTQSMLRR